MNEEFYSIGRGNLNINGKFYYGLDYEITDFMRSLEEENKQLKEQLQQKEDIINKTKDKIQGIAYSGNEDYYIEKFKSVLEILDNKGDEK